MPSECLPLQPLQYLINLLEKGLFVKYNQNDQVKKDEMGRSCDTHGGEEE
jgi:hypothetical protein